MSLIMDSQNQSIYPGVNVSSVVYRLGIYTDFDVKFQSSNTEDFKASSPFLCGTKGDTRCNDVLAIHPANPQENDLLNKYHKSILSSYKLSKEYDLLKMEDLQLNMTLSLMNLFEHMFSVESVQKAITNVFQIITTRLEEFHSLPLVLLIRKACEMARNNEVKNNNDLKIIYKKIYMRTIIFSSGPTALPSMTFPEQYACKKLSQFVKGQVDFIANDCSWIPPVLATPSKDTDTSETPSLRQ